MTTAPIPTPYEKGRYKETCGPCGAVFEVVVFGGPMAKAQNELHQDYQCPECGKLYYSRGLYSPQITLLSRRTA